MQAEGVRAVQGEFGGEGLEADGAEGDREGVDEAAHEEVQPGEVGLGVDLVFVAAYEELD